MRPAFALSALLMISACGPTAEPEAEKTATVEVARFEDLIVEGTAVEARSSGFTDCVAERNGYYGFTCASPDATILDVKPLRTIIRLEYPSDLPYDAERKPEATAYRGVEFQFLKPPSGSVEDCEYDLTNPYKCYADQSGGLPRLMAALKANGWLGGSHRSGTSFVKPGVPFTVSINTREVYQEIAGQRRLIIQVSVYPTGLEEVAAAVERLRAEERASQLSANANTDFVESMKAN